MNREEAIKWIDTLSIYLSICDNQSLKDSLSSDIEKTIKALDIAVEALKTQEEGRLIEGDCEHCFNTYGTLGCCSTVSNKWIYNCKSGMKEYVETLKAQESQKKK